MDTEMRLFESPDQTRLFFCLWGWMKCEVYKKKCGQTRRITRSHCGCCCQHKEPWRSTQTNNTRSWHTSCKLHWGLLWDLETFIVNC